MNSELMEILFLAFSATMEAFALYLTILFAYLAAAYFAGRALSRFQVISLSVIYSIVLLITIFSHLLVSEGLLEVSRALTDRDFSPFVYVLSSFMFMSWPLSLFFMAQSRKAT